MKLELIPMSWNQACAFVAKQIATRFGVAACHVRKIATGKFAWEHL